MLRRIQSSLCKTGALGGAFRWSTSAATASHNHILDGAEPVFVLISPGSRVIELRKPTSGNMLDTRTTAMVRSHVETLERNNVVQCVMFSSEDPDLFSLHNGNNGSEDVLDGLYAMAGSIKNSKKETVTMYGGAMTGTGYAAFAGSKYKLGSNVVSFKMTEMAQGAIPSCGLAHYFAKSSKLKAEMGVALARYLGVTGRAVRADQLYSMGLLTHLVEEGGHDSLMHSLAHTNPSAQDLTDMKNMDAVTRSHSIKELLDIMHIEEQVDLDILAHPAWNDYVLVPPGRWDTLEAEEALDPNELEDLETIDEQIQICFGANDIEGTRKALDAIDKSWSRSALKHMDALDSELLLKWWDLTALAAKTDTLEKFLEAEKAAV